MEMKGLKVSEVNKNSILTKTIKETEERENRIYNQSDELSNYLSNKLGIKFREDDLVIDSYGCILVRKSLNLKEDGLIPLDDGLIESIPYLIDYLVITEDSPLYKIILDSELFDLNALLSNIQEINNLIDKLNEIRKELHGSPVSLNGKLYLIYNEHCKLHMESYFGNDFLSDVESENLKSKVIMKFLSE